MFTKYLIVLSGDINLRNYKELLIHVFENTDFSKDLFFCQGPLDILDHSSDNFSFGGKAGVDATIKHDEESAGRKNPEQINIKSGVDIINSFIDNSIVKDYNLNLIKEGIPVLIVKVNRLLDPDVIEKVKSMFRTIDSSGIFRLILAIDHTVDQGDFFMVAWQILGNSDPRRDHEYISPSSVFIDGTIKAYRKGGFPRKWPNVVCSDTETISVIDQKWESLGIGQLIQSPSIKYLGLCRDGTDEIVINLL